jgi:hypothetical protein
MMQGRRAHPSTAVYDLEPGDFIKRHLTIDNVEHDAWWFCSPTGNIGRLVMPFDSPNHHHIEEHEDGMITVVTQPVSELWPEGNSNSILSVGEHPEWHGWIEHGVWVSV